MLLALTAPGISQDTLFADMGGQAGIDRIVEASVENYLADPRIKAVFEESNMDRVRAPVGIPVLPDRRRALPVYRSWHGRSA